ncbi:hypothetical protein C8J56DRAFT_291709 [Mycena floridula]|nr:hypothetical protein C8J56DRAFT_291709 [Mycena floridula]
MSDLYSTLQVSPRKKRAAPEADSNTFTPKKLRTALFTPPASASRKVTKSRDDDFPRHLARLLEINTALQNALSHALATCGVSPSSETGIARNVLNHLSLTTYSALSNFAVEDLLRLCWIWEWKPGASKPNEDGDDENPFLDEPTSSQSKDWTRGAMGIVLTPTIHKNAGKRVKAYGIGVEVEMNIDKDMGEGMAAVARWTAASDARKTEFRKKLLLWMQLNSDVSPVPYIPLATLPALASTSVKPSLPRSPSSSPSKSPAKRPMLSDFVLPVPRSPVKSSVPFPRTPSYRDHHDEMAPLTLRTPSTSGASISEILSVPSTPVHQRVSSTATPPQTPTSARRQALYERVRQRSLTASPTKNLSSTLMGGKLTRDQMQKLSQDEMRRRCLLGRLGGVAEGVWMLFSAPVTGSPSSPMTRKRRALPMVDVANAVLKSSPVPISMAEANESLEMLVQLCPFFLKQLAIGSEDWLEMPAPKVSTEGEGDATASPLPKGKEESAQEILTRSPRRVKKEGGGLREVREIIRRELELDS